MNRESVRSAFAVAAGFAGANIVSLLAESGVRSLVPHAFEPAEQPLGLQGLLLTLGAFALGGLVGGYTAAALAIRRHLAHAAAVGGVTLVTGILATIVAWDRAPAWFHIINLVLLVPMALLGGKIRTLQLR